jgi:hypothetical protein
MVGQLGSSRTIDVDHREEDREKAPKRCPICDGPLTEFEMSGRMYVSGPADQEFVLERYGFEGDNYWIAWRGLNFECGDQENCGWAWLVATA